ncbi:MAG: M23 family metallopeptidase [Leptolyngbyaceae bacterium]|nr:M23 family metallopeptidase [Leptolyngbyaceae bacterium]
MTLHLQPSLRPIAPFSRITTLLSSSLVALSLYVPLEAGALDTPLNVSRSATKQEGSSTSLCSPPVLERLIQHQVREGETIESIAAQYDLIPATILGFNPQLQNNQLSPGTQVTVPPYNGIRVSVPQGTLWQDLAEQYNMRADVLFEANGCGDVPSTAFIPGINWSPTAPPTLARRSTQPIGGHPLPAIAPVLRQYGWQTEPGTTAIDFHSGVDLDATIGTSVLSVGNGTVAFAGEQGTYGLLVVINHQDGVQTRYAQLESTSVRQGETVRAGQAIGTTGNTGNAYAPHLHFEVRTNSSLGWVAQDPALYLENMRMFER